ncbi:hypothetical protein CONPUDRAFT_161036 [Coniophora puteana RWD-64-598 SS2]|uniref:Uncharacterized protein n=1 Tax=Coniophora puteana (strain RWD-64-598) TaxID=741705 RepID=A0A5M3N4K4_CONPW|nr:uncharacterized protein CONPUDRAFT_161036 [Coniophora puteana RWD-64-598 SS2]EIW86238.1 hypothetical protein CONPUDRAFT_161036 [Coniophora puteana RWD-64-598 SS2]
MPPDTSESADAPKPVMEELTPLRYRIPVYPPEDLFHLGLPEDLLPITVRHELHFGVAFSLPCFLAFARKIRPNLPDRMTAAFEFGIRYLRRITTIRNLYPVLVQNPGSSVLPDELADEETGGVWVFSICSSDRPWAEGQPTRKAVLALSRFLDEDYHWWSLRTPSISLKYHNGQKISATIITAMPPSTSDESAVAPRDAPRRVMEKPTPIRMRIPVYRPEDLFRLSLPKRFLPATAIYELHYGVAFSLPQFLAFVRSIKPDLPDRRTSVFEFGMRYLRRITTIRNLYPVLVKNPGSSVIPDELVDAETGGIWVFSICSFDHPWAEGQPSRKAVDVLSGIVGDDYHWWLSRQPKPPK